MAPFSLYSLGLVVAVFRSQEMLQADKFGKAIPVIQKKKNKQTRKTAKHIERIKNSPGYGTGSVTLDATRVGGSQEAPFLSLQEE